MTLLQPQHFITVVETGSFTYVTRQAYISQSIISRQIQMLEEKLRYFLFNRNNRPLHLTEPRQILYEGIREVISRISNTPEKARTVSKGKEEVLSISFQSSYLSEYVFLPTINKLHKTNPTLQIRSNKLFSWDQIKGLKNESIGVVVDFGFPHRNKLGLTVRRLKKVETLIVMPISHRLARKETLEYNGLCEETFSFTASNGYQVGKIFKYRFCLDDIHQVEVSSSKNVCFKVSSDNGLTILNPYDPVPLNSPHYHAVKFDSEYADSYVYVTDPDNTNPAIQLFLDLVQTDCESGKRRSVSR